MRERRPAGREAQPELAAERRGSPRTTAFRARRGAEASAAAAEAHSFAVRRRPRSTTSTGGCHEPPPRPGDRAALPNRDWILFDLHMHTSWSHDCSVDVDDLLDYAEAQGLGAIAVTDHNVFGGALEAVERARGRNLS